MPRRVLYLIPSMVAGGAERVVLEHLRRLPRERFAPELALHRRVGALLPEVPGDVPVHELRGGMPSGLRRRAHGLRRLVAARSIDVVVSHQPQSDLVALAAGRGLPAARVCWIHADLSAIRRARLRWRARLMLALLDRLYRRAEHVVFLTRRTADTFAPRWRLAPERVSVVPNAVDPEALARRAADGPAPDWPGGGARLLGVGRLAPQKGFEVLLRALAQARDETGLDASLLLIGEGPARGDLEALVRELGLGDRVSLPGHASNPYPAMRAADLFVLPSRWEGFPLVLLEAIALGKAVLAADCPAGPAELLAGGIGALVERNDPQALASKLAELCADADLRARLEARARERAPDYAWERALARIERVLGSVTPRP